MPETYILGLAFLLWDFGNEPLLGLDAVEMKANRSDSICLF